MKRLRTQYPFADLRTDESVLGKPGGLRHMSNPLTPAPADHFLIVIFGNSTVSAGSKRPKAKMAVLEAMATCCLASTK